MPCSSTASPSNHWLTASLSLMASLSLFDSVSVTDGVSVPSYLLTVSPSSSLLTVNLVLLVFTLLLSASHLCSSWESGVTLEYIILWVCSPSSFLSNILFCTSNINIIGFVDYHLRVEPAILTIVFIWNYGIRYIKWSLRIPQLITWRLVENEVHRF